MGSKPALNLKVIVFDRDFYAREAINSYLAWDRRTRVIALVDNFEELFTVTKMLAFAEQPDIVLLEAEAFADATTLRKGIERLRKAIPHVTVMCLGHKPDGERASAAFDAGARAYFLRHEVTVYIVSAIAYAMESTHTFIITSGVRQAAESPYDERIYHAHVLPKQRDFPGLTNRIRQALWLCVIEGLPAQLAADEMGVSPHTIRSYIKEGYRILEANDETSFPEDMGPLERAFMRFTALGTDEDEPEIQKPE
jgi:DNA-binding NarL/FixJ family response regulator